MFLYQIVVSKPEDCQSFLTAGIRRSGEYTIWINGVTPTAVYCDMVTDGGGWTVFQKRTDGSTNFYRGWGEYKRGFGNRSHEFWLGLDAIHALTKRGDVSLRIDLKTFTGLNYHAKYLKFGVGAEITNYKLHVSGYSGTAGDHLNRHSGKAFSTKDRDNDAHQSIHCAAVYKGAWWFDNCYNSDLNALYSRTATTIPYIYWGGLPKIQFTEMKLRGKAWPFLALYHFPQSPITIVP